MENFWVLILIFGAIFGAQALPTIDDSEPISCPNNKVHGKTFQECCQDLKDKAEEEQFFNRTCCQLPDLLMPRREIQKCEFSCNVTAPDFNRTHLEYCCVTDCNLRHLKIIDDHPEVNGILLDGLIESYLYSVDYDERWTELIKSTLKKNFEKYRKEIPKITNDTNSEKIYNDFWDCYETIPNYIDDIIYETSKELYYLCPLFDGADRCQNSKAHVRDCLTEHEFYLMYWEIIV